MAKRPSPHDAPPADARRRPAFEESLPADSLAVAPLEDERGLPSPAPHSSLSAEVRHTPGRHHEGGAPEPPDVITAGDVDANFAVAYSSGDEAPGGDNPTPDQDGADAIGRALGVEYDDTEELLGAEKIAERDRHRWELDPASSEDFRERGR